MKKILIASAALIAVGVYAVPEDNSLVKITSERIPMDKRLVFLCSSPEAARGPHAVAEVDIYVNKEVVDYRKKNPNNFSYPVGSKFVKKKYSKIGAKDPDLATIMIRERMDGSISDWKFSMESLPDHTPLESKARTSCASCHERFEERGYISWQSENALREFLKI